MLAELLLFAGNLERADTILDAAAAGRSRRPWSAIAEFRQLLRADMARRQLRRDGRVPEFLGEPTPALRASLAAFVALRAGDSAEAARHAAEAEELAAARRRTLPATIGFDDFRDVDDLHAGFFEVLTTTGKYFWIPTERVASIEFHPPRRPRDLAWRRASVSVIDGPDGDVYLPAIYDSEPADARRRDSASAARPTGSSQEGGPMRGVGQRVFLVGDEAAWHHGSRRAYALAHERTHRAAAAIGDDGAIAQLPLLDRLIDDAPDDAARPAAVAGRGHGGSAPQRAARPRGPAEHAPALALVAGRILPSWRSRRSATASPIFPPAPSTTRTGATGCGSEVEQTIRRFEPRLTHVRVTLVEPEDSLEATLRLRIEALLRAEPAPEPIAFDTLVDATTAEVMVRTTAGEPSAGPSDV